MKIGIALVAFGLIGGVGVAPQDTTPSQVHISYGEDPTRMMRVMWQTASPTGTRTVEYGETKELGMVAPGIQPTYPYQTGAICEATLYNLKPKTKYFYRVGSKEGGFSPVREFMTAEPDPKEFVFTAYGDHGVSSDAAKNVENVLFEKPAFHLMLGDISYANGDQPIWDKYLQQIEPMTSVIPYMLTLGNHENEDIKIDGASTKIGYMSTLARFAMPGAENWYTFDYGCARFVSINSDAYKAPGHLEWLDATLATARKDPSVKWIVVMQHHPVYGTSKGRGDNQGLIDNVAPIYDKYKVDLVLQGHDHHYERQYPMRSNAIASKDKSKYKKGVGTLYVIEGGGGRPMYDFSDPMPEKCALREKTNGYLRVKVTKKSISLEAKRLDRSLIEKYEISE
ncbi:MAG: metallophosphoesterase family protein [Armatimonadota bacterium]